MAVSLKHAFTSAVPDGGDTSLVQPSNWNAEHNLTLGTGKLLGRTTAGTGAAEEITAGTGLTLSAGSLAVSVTTPQTNTSNTFTANQIISVTDNTNAALRITQLGTGEAIRVEDSTNPDSTPFVVTADGNVGLGTSTPLVQFHAQANTSLGLLNYTAGGGTSYLFRRSSGTTASPTVVSSGDTVVSTAYQGYDGSSFVSAAAIAAVIDGTPGTNDMPGRLTFSTTADGASSPTERMRIRSDGGVGIGSSGSSNVGLTVAKNITGSANSAGVYLSSTSQPDVTNVVQGFTSQVSTAANGGVGYTVAALRHFYVNQGTINADSTITTQAAFYSDGTLIGGTTNLGFYAGNTAAVTTGKTAVGFRSDVNTATGGGTTYGFYAGGTANNYFNGNVGVGTASPDVKLQVANTSSAASPTWAGGTDFLKLFAGSGSTYSEQALAFQETGTNVGAKIGVKNTSNGAYNIIFANRDTSSTTSTMTERFRIGTSGQLGIGGANYGTSGQTIISGGSAAAPAWGTLGVSGGGTGATTANAGLTNLTTLTSTATAAGTTTLTNTSTYFQLFTGTTTQTVVLPVTSTLATGWTFHIVNNSTGNLTVNSSGGNLVVTVLPGTTAMCTCIGTTLTTAADWEAGITNFSTATGTGSVVLANDPVFSTGIRIGTGGTLAAGSIYSNANWGMLFQAKQASPALGDYALLNSAGTIRMAINASGALGVGSTPSYGTAGQVLTSNGTGSAPTWGTLGVAGGGTGVTSATAYALLAGGTTSTGAFQSLGTGTAGQVLTSNGSAAVPTWTSLTSGAVYIAGGIVTSSASLSFTSIPTYSKLLMIASHSTTSTGGRTLNVALSSNNGTSYGTANAFTVSAISTASATAQTIAQISNTGSSGTSKTVTGYSSGMNNNATTVTATDAVTTGIIDAIQITCSNTVTSGFVTLWGIP